MFIKYVHASKKYLNNRSSLKPSSAKISKLLRLKDGTNSNPKHSSILTNLSSSMPTINPFRPNFKNFGKFSICPSWRTYIPKNKNMQSLVRRWNMRYAGYYWSICRGVPISLYKPVIDGLFFHKAHQTCIQEYERVAKIHQRKLKDLEISFKKNKNHLFLNASGVLALARIKLFLHENEGELQ